MASFSTQFSSGSFSVGEQEEEQLQGRRRRRGRTRIYREPEPEVEVLDVSEIAKEFSHRLIKTGQELARAKLELREALDRVKRAEGSKAAVASAEGRVWALEQELERIREEEELILVLSVI